MQAGADQPQAPAAIRTGLGVIFVALELRRSTFLITALSPGGGSALSNSRRGRGCERGRPFRSSSSRKLAATDSGSILCSRRKQSKATPSIRLRSRHRAGAGGSGGKSSRPAMPRPSRQRRAKPSPSPWTMDPSTPAKRRAPRRPSASAGSRPNGWRNMRPSSTTSSAIGKPLRPIVSPTKPSTAATASKPRSARTSRPSIQAENPNRWPIGESPLSSFKYGSPFYPPRAPLRVPLRRAWDARGRFWPNPPRSRRIPSARRLPR